jgi:hypothetical protein
MKPKIVRVQRQTRLSPTEAVVEDSVARADGLLRVVDETGEDYLYPAEWFIAVDVPAPVQESVLRATR